MTGPLPPHYLPLDDPAYFRAERQARYTYTALNRLAQRLLWLLATIIPGALGLDVSKWQTFVSWAVSQSKDIQFAFIRALFGLTVDSQFQAHWINSKVAGTKRGAYLYYLDNLSPLAQAQKLFDTLAATGDLGELPPVIDVEGISNATLTASKIKQCAEKLTWLFGKKPIIYTGFYVWKDEVTGDKAWASTYELWIAAYPFGDWKPEYLETVLNYPPLLPYPWSKWDVWQWSAFAPASEYGVSGNFLDLDYCSVAFAEKYGIGANEPPPPPIGDDPTVKFTNKTTMNIREQANVTSPITGSLPPNTTITAQAVIPTTASSVWVKFGEKQHVALVHAGIIYLTPA